AMRSGTVFSYQPSPVTFSFEAHRPRGCQTPINSILYSIMRRLIGKALNSETFEKCQILFEFKEGENFNQRNTLSILRIKI
ncbi:MAG: hypothetical protein Q8P24_03325, partial [Desulfobacterales bacterium]|nr:hypothetical protein [Desulfobacterales bacterium]